MKSYKILIDKYKNDKNKIGFIVATGCSLYYLYKHKRWNEIFGHVVISVNSSIIIMPWLKGEKDDSYFITNDALIRKWDFYQSCILKFNMIKVIRNSWKRYFKEIPDALIFKPRPTEEAIVNPEDTGLCYASSCLSGLDLMIQMNVKKIFLLGLDHYKYEDKFIYFWELFPKSKQPWMPPKFRSPYVRQKEVFEINKIVFKSLAKFAKLRNIEVYNVNRKSKVNTFPKITFEEALEIANENENI